MTKQELLENYTMEQLADMVVEIDEKNKKLDEKLRKTWEMLREQEKKNIECQNEINCLKAELKAAEENIDSKTLADFLPTESIKVADMLINAEGEYERNAIGKAFYGNDKGAYNLFNVSELRQIAEHLLVYCNANESEVK